MRIFITLLFSLSSSLTMHCIQRRAEHRHTLQYWKHWWWWWIHDNIIYAPISPISSSGTVSVNPGTYFDTNTIAGCIDIGTNSVYICQSTTSESVTYTPAAGFNYNAFQYSTGSLFLANFTICIASTYKSFAYLTDAGNITLSYIHP